MYSIFTIEYFGETSTLHNVDIVVNNTSVRVYLYNRFTYLIILFACAQLYNFYFHFILFIDSNDREAREYSII